MRDHPELSFRTLQKLSEAQAQKANMTIVKDYFEKLGKIINEHSLTTAQIWNMDETGFILIPKSEKVIAQKGACQVHKVIHENTTEHISVIPTISAAGSSIPPLFIYKGVRTISGLLEGAPPRAVMGFTDTGYMREDLFQMYLDHFINFISSIRPVLLILDGHKSHINYMSVGFCHQNNILLFALPTHMIHILQPSEIPFAKLKKGYSKAYDKYHTNNGKTVTKHTFAEIFGPIFIETYTPLAICNAYRTTGIWLFNPSAISDDCLDPFLLTEQFNEPADQPLILPLLSQPNHFHFTRLNVNSLKEENIILKNENDLLRSQVEKLNEELETYKNPGTCALRLALKYPFEPMSFLPKKKRKTLPFARLLIEEESWHQLNELNEKAERKAEEIKRKKEIAAQKKEAAA
ncbi:13535_t:CDS:2 [Cetraspora pellucida]|uniref:13535_t:CDS:1 n=1 Tax=Cetraspora pellucida TaxID=1433469 RepID=A0A9N9IKM4_9GLOM|nr:13535_t:CDS:2 [Cetraspora pellucida]